MMLLGEEEASEILKNLGPKEVQQLGKEMYNVQGLDQDTVNRVMSVMSVIFVYEFSNIKFSFATIIIHKSNFSKD